MKNRIFLLQCQLRDLGLLAQAHRGTLCGTHGGTMTIGIPDPRVLVKRYAGRRLYRPATSVYLTREDLMTMAENGEAFVVVDASTHEDVTPSYRPIIVEQ
jgi:hypothetical protein